MERPFVAENAKERERLRSLVERLTDKELSLPLGNGWTNGRKAVLNHHR
jgi:hypothetical protein